MNIPFDIKCRPQIESGEYKVVTDVGEPVEVVKWDCKGKCPILAVIDDGDTHDSCFYDENGVSYSGKECIYILTDELELTEFEKEFDSCVENIQNSYGDDRKRNIRFYANTLLEIARKQLESEFQQAYESGKATAERIDKSAQEWYEKGRADAIAEMQKPAWSEEDEKLFNSALWHIKNSCGNGGKNYGEFEVYHWFRNLKNRMLPEPEWNEETKAMIYSIIADIKYAERMHPDVAQSLYDEEINFLKSLRPQNRWKPSDEQMDALQYVYRNLNPLLSDKLGWNSLKTLEMMYQDLKKLKG